MKFKQVLWNVIGSIFWIAFIGFWGIGTYHSFSKHDKDDDWGFSLSPLAIYRGVEIFWHDDFSGVDWERRLRNDVTSLYILMNIYRTPNENIDDVNMSVEKFSSKINTYPSEKREYLRSAASSYITYVNRTMNNVLNTLEQVKHNPNSPVEAWNSGSKNYYDSIYSHYGYVDVSQSERTIDSVLRMIVSEYRSGRYDDRQFQASHDNLRKINELGRKRLFDFYKEVFKTPFIEQSEM